MVSHQPNWVQNTAPRAGLGRLLPCRDRKRECFSMLRRFTEVRHQVVRKCLTDCLTQSQRGLV